MFSTNGLSDLLILLRSSSYSIVYLVCCSCLPPGAAPSSAALFCETSLAGSNRILKNEEKKRTIDNWGTSSVILKLLQEQPIAIDDTV